MKVERLPKFAWRIKLGSPEVGIAVYCSNTHAVRSVVMEWSSAVCHAIARASSLSGERCSRSKCINSLEMRNLKEKERERGEKGENEKEGRGGGAGGEERDSRAKYSEGE